MILDLYKYQTFKLVTGQFCTITGTKACGLIFVAEGQLSSYITKISEDQCLTLGVHSLAAI